MIRHSLIFLICFFAVVNSLAYTPDTVQVKTDISILASDSLQGRASGTLGNLKARCYISSRLKDMGYHVIFDQFTYKDSIPLCNIIAVKKGKCSGNNVVVGAHYDHLGIVDGEIYNGADDNASGVSCVLQLAEKFSKKNKQSHSIVFAFWDGEELGLLGSMHYVRNHINDSIIAYINFDMVGRNSDQSNPWSLSFHYTEKDEYFVKWQKEIIVRENLSIKPIYKRWNLKGGSDNTSFAVNNIACAWWHTDGHCDYHKPSDISEKINYPKLFEIIKSSYYVVSMIVNK